MAMVNLIETAVSLDALREYARKELVDLLNEVTRHLAAALMTLSTHYNGVCRCEEARCW